MSLDRENIKRKPKLNFRFWLTFFLFGRYQRARARWNGRGEYFHGLSGKISILDIFDTKNRLFEILMIFVWDNVYSMVGVNVSLSKYRQHWIFISILSFFGRRESRKSFKLFSKTIFFGLVKSSIKVCTWSFVFLCWSVAGLTSTSPSVTMQVDNYLPIRHHLLKIMIQTKTTKFQNFKLYIISIKNIKN